MAGAVAEICQIQPVCKAEVDGDVGQIYFHNPSLKTSEKRADLAVFLILGD